MRTRSVGVVGTLCSLVLAAGCVSYAAAASPSPRKPDPGRLDSGLALLTTGAAASRPGAVRQTSGYARSPSRDAVLVDVYVDGPLAETVRALHDLGMTVDATYTREPYKMVEGFLPIDRLDEATAIAGAQALVGVPAESTNQGSVLSEGDAAHHGPQVRALGTTGAGVKVGIISDSMNRTSGGGGLSGSQASGNLPGPASSPAGSVTILKEGSSGSDEGRAMAEIVYDTAPGIRQMYFAEGIGAADKADSINQLVNAGVDVIADDTLSITEPFFQDGIVTQAADAAAAAGVTYLVSAGNRARQSWEGTYVPTTDPRSVSPTANDFDPGAGADAVQTVGTFSNRNMFVELQWAEPVGAVTDDFAVDVYDNGSFVFAVDSNNISSGLSGEFVGISVPGGSHTIAIGIRRVTGSGTPKLKYIVGGAGTFSIAEYPTSSHAIDPDAASAAGTLTVAATNQATPQLPEGFSSRGPAVTRYFSPAGVALGSPDVRAKPNLAGADGVSTSLPSFSPFFGTSAAAPSAAGVAALVLSANPALTLAQVRAIMTDPANALDCTSTAGQPDLDCGAGFILADKAVAAADASPPVITAHLSPAPNSRGWVTSSTTLSWTVSDTASPVTMTTGCGPVSLTADGLTTKTCSATSSGGSANRSITVKRDATAPVKVKLKGLKSVYSGGAVPVASKLKCRAKDPTSGVASCKIKGVKTSTGTHQAKAIATNGAGLRTKVTVTYTIR